MKFEQINRRFTEKVAELLSHGYIMNATTMGGSQGEIAKVDLTDGKKVVRVMLSTEHDWERIGDRCYTFDKVILTIGTNTDNVRIHGSDRFCDTIWNNHLIDVTTEEFYQIGRRGNWYGTKEDAISQQDKSMERMELDDRSKDITSAAAARIVLPFIRRQPRCKSVNISDIQKIEKKVMYFYDASDSRPVKYIVTARGHRYFLK